MAYAFDQSSGVASQVRAIALEQIDKALDTIRADDDFDRTVHALRRSTKKLRALLKLVRPVFDDYQSENAAVKAIADRFAVARDAAVMVETLAQLVERAPEVQANNDGDYAGSLLDRLHERAWHLKRQTGEADLLEQSRTDFLSLRDRAQGWTFDATGQDIVMPGLRRSYSRFRSGLGQAQDDPDGEVVHDWRKAAKTWWYHVRLFEPSAPAVLFDLARHMDSLGKSLGDHHNLAVLADWVRASRGPGDATTDALLDTIALRQAALLENAFDIGRQLAAERPEAVVRRFKSYWRLME